VGDYGGGSRVETWNEYISDYIDTYQLIALHRNVRPRLPARHFGNGETDRRLCAYAPFPAEPMDI
jgi:hypothetical protein